MEQVTKAITGPLSSGSSSATLGYSCQICGRFRSIEFGIMVICPECAKRLKKLLYEEEEK